MFLLSRASFWSVARLCAEVSHPSLGFSKCSFSSTKVIAKDIDDIKSGVTVTRDGSTIVCWHPEEPFPYECSKPLPEAKVSEISSVLKVQGKENVMSVFKEKPQEFIDQELCRITFTSKHRWAPRKSSIKRKKTPPQREWL